MSSFPVLSFVSQLLRVLGWIVVVLGLIAAIVGFANPGFMVNRFAGMVPGLGAAISGLVIVAVGESIGVLFAIEANTRATAEKAKELAVAVKLKRTSALPQIMTGLNQTIMLSLSMVVIAAMIGAGGLGGEVWRAIQRLEPGKGFESGIAIVVLAMILDRITHRIGERKY